MIPVTTDRDRDDHVGDADGCAYNNCGCDRDNGCDHHDQCTRQGGLRSPDEDKDLRRRRVGRESRPAHIPDESRARSNRGGSASQMKYENVTPYSFTRDGWSQYLAS